MRIPKVRNDLTSIAVDLRKLADQIDMLVNELHRRKSARAPNTSVPLTPALKKQIRAFKKQRPKVSHAYIGTCFNVNPGRVSEALSGHRH